MKLRKVFEKMGLLAAILSLAGVLLIVITYFGVAIPLADDYGRATTHSFSEAIARTVFTYQSWAGRWAAMFLQFGIWGVLFKQGGHFFEVYRASLAVLGGISFLSVLWISRYAVCGGRWRRLVCGTAFAATYLAVYHAPGETLYWLPGATEGGLAAVSAGLAVWLTIGHFFEKQGDKPFGGLVVVGLLSILSPGFHELGGLFLCCFFALCLLATSVFDLGGKKAFLLVALVVAIAAAAFSVFAPGNTVRAQHSLPDSVSIAMAANSCAQIWIRTLRVLVSPPLLLGAMIVLVLNRRKSFLRHPLQPRLYAILATCAGASLVVVSAIVAWKSGHNPAARTVNFFITTCMLTSLPLLVLFVAKKMESVVFEIPRSALACLYFMFAVAVMAESTMDRGLFSYKRSLVPWLKYQMAKHAYLQQDHGDSEVLLAPPPPGPPMLAAGSDVTQNADAWINQTQAVFYGVKAIRMENIRGRKYVLPGTSSKGVGSGGQEASD